MGSKGGILADLARRVEINRQKAIDSPLLRARWRKLSAGVFSFSAPSTPKLRVKSMLTGIQEDRVPKMYLSRTNSEYGIGIGNSEDSEEDQNLFCLFQAIRDGKHKKVKCIVKEKRLRLNRLNVRGVAPLHEACYLGSIKCVKILVEHGADVNFTDSEGWTPLHAAVCGEHTSCIKYLVENQADINVSDMQGISPLRIAVNVKNIELIDYLVKRGADVMSTSKDGKSTLQFAIELGDDEILTYFLHLPSLHVD